MISAFGFRGSSSFKNTSGGQSLMPEQVEMIKQHLALVFKHEIGPQQEPPHEPEFTEQAKKILEAMKRQPRKMARPFSPPRSARDTQYC